MADEQADSLEQARRRIKSWDADSRLDLADLGLTALPDELFEVGAIDHLDLSSNPLDALPAALSALPVRALTAVNVSLGVENIRLLPRSVEVLSISVDADEARELAGLENLKDLSLYSYRASELPDELGTLPLEELLITTVPFGGMPQAILKLRQLRVLILDGCELLDLTEEIGELSSLQSLSVTRTGLRTLPSSLGNLQQLRTLWIDGNELSELPASFAGLSGLNSLYAARNEIRDLTPIAGLKLETLSVSENPIRALPPGLDAGETLEQLDLEGTELPIPPEVLAQTGAPRRILEYYRRLGSEDHRALNEAKLILVGQGGVGKTSIVKGLLGRGFDEAEGKTRGIDISRLEAQLDGSTIAVNIWDFGGQEIMHATHQFFLTKRSVYLLVLDSRISPDQNRVEYWLKIIQSFAGGSPVIVVGNKSDQHALDLDRRGLQEKYPTIRAFVETSCSDGRGLDELRAAIDTELDQLDHIHDRLPVSWFEVKRRMEALEEDYIPYDRYRSICLDEGIEDDVSQRTLAGFLNDLGIILNFSDDPRLEDTNILNPDWVTEGVYRILNSNELFQAHGVLERSALDGILDPVTHPPARHLFIMDMMRKFELCFDFEGQVDERFLVPDLLSQQEPYTGDDWDDALAFEYAYDVLPSSVISRFIVRLHHMIDSGVVWRNGVVLRDGSNRAFVRADAEDRRVTLRVSGPIGGRRRLLGAIRTEFAAIHASIPGLDVRQKVPVPGRTDVLVAYDHLCLLEEKRHARFIPEGMSEEVEVAALLDGVEPRSERDERRTGENEFAELARAKGGPVSSPDLERPAVAPAGPWRSGSFYLVALVAIVALCAALFALLSWSAAIAALVLGALLVIVIAAFQLRHDDRVSESGMLTLVSRSLDRLPRLRGDGPREDVPDDVPSIDAP